MVSFKLIVILGTLALNYIITTIMTFLAIDPSSYGNYLTFLNALVIFWLVLPSNLNSPLDTLIK